MGTSLMVNFPSAPVRAPSAVPTTVTDTLAIGAPAVRSVIVPTMRPVVPPCACAPDAQRSRLATARERVPTARIRVIEEYLRLVAAEGRLRDFCLQRTKAVWGWAAQERTAGDF